VKGLKEEFKAAVGDGMSWVAVAMPQIRHDGVAAPDCAAWKEPRSKTLGMMSAFKLAAYRSNTLEA
jgi:hypothetical protein